MTATNWMYIIMYKDDDGSIAIKEVADYYAKGISREAAGKGLCVANGINPDSFICMLEASPNVRVRFSNDCSTIRFSTY